MGRLLFFKRADLLTQILCLLMVLPCIPRLHSLLLYAPGLFIVCVLQILSIILNWRMWPARFRNRFRRVGVVALVALLVCYMVVSNLPRMGISGYTMFRILLTMMRFLPLVMFFYLYITFDELMQITKARRTEDELAEDNVIEEGCSVESAIEVIDTSKYKTIYRYKQADLVLQILCFCWGIVFMWQSDGRLADVLDNEIIFVVYFVVGGVQLVSAIVNKVALPGEWRVAGRKWYEGILLLLAISLLMSVAAEQILLAILIVLLFASPLLAIGYLWITIAETMRLKNSISKGDDNITE